MSCCCNKRRLKDIRHRSSGRPGHHRLFPHHNRSGIDLNLTICLRTALLYFSIQSSHLQAMISRLHITMRLLLQPCLRTLLLIAGKVLKILLLLLVLLDSKLLPVDRQVEDIIRYQMNILPSNYLSPRTVDYGLVLPRYFQRLESRLQSSSHYSNHYTIQPTGLRHTSPA